MRTAIQHLIDYCSGRLKRRTLLWTVFPLIMVSYFGSLIFAIWSFPGPFNWRTKAMSKLLYPATNPQFHAVVSAGIAMTGLLILPFAGYIGRRLRVIARRPAQLGAVVFGAGAISLSLGAVVVWQPFHERFARSAGICLGLGILTFYWCALRGFSGPSDERPTRRRLLLAWSLIVIPALLVVMLRLLVVAQLRWSNPLYRALGNRAWWHLGFWEWLISAAVFLFLLGAAGLMPETA